MQQLFSVKIKYILNDLLIFFPVLFITLCYLHGFKEKNPNIMKREAYAKIKSISCLYLIAIIHTQKHFIFNSLFSCKIDILANIN